MSSKHEGVTCDECSRKEFTLRRYKCLICLDYDLCGTCFDNGNATSNHKSGHPMQCLLTKADHSLFYNGEDTSKYFALSFTCPICGQLGYSKSFLSYHVFQNHPIAGHFGVLCPYCAISNQNQNYVTNDLSNHFKTFHQLSATNDKPAHESEPLTHLTENSNNTVPVLTPTAINRHLSLRTSFGRNQLRSHASNTINETNSNSTVQPTNYDITNALDFFTNILWNSSSKDVKERCLSAVKALPNDCDKSVGLEPDTNSSNVELTCPQETIKTNTINDSAMYPITSGIDSQNAALNGVLSISGSYKTDENTLFNLRKEDDIEDEDRTKQNDEDRLIHKYGFNDSLCNEVEEKTKDDNCIDSGTMDQDIKSKSPSDEWDLDWHLFLIELIRSSLGSGRKENCEM